MKINELNKDSVCAVVVTYNRKELLIECLEALKNQTRPLQGIYIIDNASTDGTPELLLEKRYIKELPPKNLSEPWEKEFEIKNSVNKEPIKIHYVRMNENTGGAGGFHEGVKRGYKKGYDWLWLMDDDTISLTDSLYKLLNKIKFLNKEKIGFLCSKVIWIDGNPHVMNLPQIKTKVNNFPFNLYEDKNILLVETASFVSLLIRRKVIKQIGLPLKEFFIWADDVEYTMRITKSGFWGFYVKDSKVYHKTKENYSANNIYDWRFYYNTRNRLWIYRKYNKKKYLFYIFKQILLTTKLPTEIWHTNLKACIDSLINSPKIEKIKGK